MIRDVSKTASSAAVRRRHRGFASAGFVAIWCQAHQNEDRSVGVCSLDKLFGQLLCVCFESLTGLLGCLFHGWRLALKSHTDLVRPTIRCNDNAFAFLFSLKFRPN